MEFNTPPNIIEVISEADNKDSLTVCWQSRFIGLIIIIISFINSYTRQNISDVASSEWIFYVINLIYSAKEFIDRMKGLCSACFVVWQLLIS